MEIELQTDDGVPTEQAEAARERIAALDSYRGRTPSDGRLTLRGLRSLNGGRFYVAEASVTVDGRQLVARATGDTALAAATSTADEFRRRIRASCEPRVPPSGDDAHMVLPGEWVAWAREARRGWRRQRQTLVRELQFRDFESGIGFLTEIGRRGGDYFRRPEMSISGGHVRLAISNPNRAGITLAELRLAAKVNALVEEFALHH
jgi:pterin-4a-carbinolamine dehydratase